jgi:hypothetical protein
MAALAAIPVVASAQLTPRAATSVSGKEYSNLIDEDTNSNTPAPGQISLWDGSGAAVNGPVLGLPGASIETDALANGGDAFFFDVINNQAALLVSLAADPSAVVGGPRVSVWGINNVGTASIWAYQSALLAPATVNSGGTMDDLDGLEVWGSDGSSDTTHFSTFGDIGGFAIYDTAGNGVLSSADLRLMIGADGDLDALMMGGDFILFSVRANAVFDGGEIWVGNMATKTATFLVHGGRTWDTANNVASIFNCNTEEIDALEAVDLVPEPASMIALGLGAAGLLRRRAKKA